MVAQRTLNPQPSEGVSVGSNPTGATKIIKKMDKIIKELYESSISEIKAILSLSETYNMLNTQEFINWCDELNKISCEK